MPCRRHGDHVVTLHSGDDLSWLMAEAHAMAITVARHSPAKVYKWFLPVPFVPQDIMGLTGEQIEDDIPF